VEERQKNQFSPIISLYILAGNVAKSIVKNVAKGVVQLALNVVQMIIQITIKFMQDEFV
jgi:hypothetical protein